MKKVDDHLKQYEEELYYSYAKANTKSKKKRLVDDLFAFSRLCHDEFLIFKTFEWENDKSFRDISDYDNNIFKENVLKNINIYNKLSELVVNIYKDTEFPLYKSYADSYRDFHRLKKGEMVEIISSFLNILDPKLVKNFRDKLSYGDLFKVQDDDSDSYGYTCEFKSLKKNLMFINSNSNGDETIRVACTIMHEFGHDYEMDLYHNSGIVNNMWLYPFHEVSSCFFEYAFINYLIDNKIYSNDIKAYNRMFFIELFYFMFGVNLFSDVVQVSKDEYIIDFDNVEKKELMIQEKMNYYGMTDYEFEDFDKYFTYGTGYLFAPYLYENFKSDSKIFMKEFQDAILTYPYTNSINTFEGVGVTENELLKGNVLRRVLKDSR